MTERVENRFIGPTLLALTGVTPPDSMPSVNLLDDAERAEHGHGRFHRSTHHGWIRVPESGAWQPVPSLHGLQDDRWLFLWGQRGDAGEDIFNLYDLVADPGAQADVSADHADVVAELHAELDQILLATQERREAIDAMEGAEDRAAMEALGYVGDD